MSQTGQWYVYTGEDKDAIAVAEHGVGPNGGWVGIDIAKMPIPGKYKTQADINKNARLIASAPDLLELLQDISEYLEGCADADIEGPNEEMRLYMRAREVIAKATGGSHD